MKVLLKNIKEKDVFHFHPKEYSEIANWCRENLFIAKKDDKGKIYFYDTYWGLGCGGDSHTYTFAEANELGKLEYYCNLNEVEVIGQHKIEYFDEKDIFRLHDQHACVESCNYYFVRKGAKRSKEKMLQVLNEKLEKAKHEIEWQVARVDEYSAKKKEVELGNLEIYI